MNRSTFSPFCWVNPLFPLENKAFLVHTLHGLLHITAIQSLFIYLFFELPSIQVSDATLLCIGSASSCDDVSGSLNVQQWNR